VVNGCQYHTELVSSVQGYSRFQREAHKFPKRMTKRMPEAP
jgi:hypothetical protein